MSSLKNAIEEIKSLEDEKRSLLIEIEGLKRIADAKVSALEKEVDTLREEVKIIKAIIEKTEEIPKKNQI